MFTAIESKKISQVVIEQIQAMIMSGQLKAGDRLPAERQLTALFQIGRPALREALKALEVLGLVECRHGLGNYIVNNVENNFFKPLSLSFKLNGGSVQEILELRFLLESFAVRAAARLAAPEDIAILKEKQKKMMDAATPTEKSAYDKEFHFEIVRICKNSLILNTYENASYLMASFFEQTVQLSYLDDDSIDYIYTEHQNIINAIEHHEEESAVSYLNIHLKKINLPKLHEL